MGEGQNAVHFSLSIFHGQVYGLECPLRVVGAQFHFPYLPWWLKTTALLPLPSVASASAQEKEQCAPRSESLKVRSHLIDAAELVRSLEIGDVELAQRVWATISITPSRYFSGFAATCFRGETAL